MENFKNLPLDIKIEINKFLQKKYKKEINKEIITRRNIFIVKVFNKCYSNLNIFTADFYYWANSPDYYWGNYNHKDEFINFFKKIFPNKKLKKLYTPECIYNIYEKSKYEFENYSLFINYCLSNLSVEKIENLYNYIIFIDYQNNIFVNKSPLTYNGLKSNWKEKLLL